MWESIREGIKTNASTLALLIVIGAMLMIEVGELKLNMATSKVKTEIAIDALVSIKKDLKEVICNQSKFSERITRQEAINEQQEKHISLSIPSKWYTPVSIDEELVQLK